MSNIVGEERYVFETEWNDLQASVIRQYRVTFYPLDSTIEMVNLSTFKINSTMLKIRGFS